MARRSEELDWRRVEGIAPPLGESQAEAVARELDERLGVRVYPASLLAADGHLFFVARRAEGLGKVLGVVSGDPAFLTRFEGVRGEGALEGGQAHWLLGELSPANAEALRGLFPFLVAQPLGLRKSAGCGDRLGLATPGHVRAIRKSTMAPILAQQSIRENARTGRTPQQVMDEAMWGVLQEGWRGGFGSDADHLKTTADIDLCAAAGFTFYTIDPGDHVDNEANTAGVERLRELAAQLPWAELETSWEGTIAALGRAPIDLGDFSVTLSEEDLLRAAAKYGKVVAYTVRMYRHLAAVKGEAPFELEMSVDETETGTTLAEHIYIAHELKRLGVRWVSLAPRYVGDFEKGVDYIGDLAAFAASFAEHFAVAKKFGPYKLSLHSGSDKFSVYPIASRIAGELVHLKTAGTSYLEALRAIAEVNPSLFRRIVAFARDRYPTDRATYHVSAEVSRMPALEGMDDARLIDLLDDFHAREILHVTYGSVLQHPDFREPFFAALEGAEEVYYGMLERHFDRHFSPFAETARATGD